MDINIRARERPMKSITMDTPMVSKAWETDVCMSRAAMSWPVEEHTMSVTTGRSQSGEKVERV